MRWTVNAGRKGWERWSGMVVETPCVEEIITEILTECGYVGDQVRLEESTDQFDAYVRIGRRWVRVLSLVPAGDR